MHYYQFNIGDYASHTRYLTQLEDLGYRRLLDLYYLSEKPLPADVVKVARVIGMPECFGQIEAVLLEFFTLTKAGWVNKRADEDIAKYHSKADAARANGKKGGRPKGKINPEITQAGNSANPEITGSKANHKPITINQEPYIKEVSQGVPFKLIVDLYHKHLPTLPAVNRINTAREKSMRARWNEDARRQNIGWWDGYFQFVLGNSDMCWEDNGSPKRWFKFDFLINENKMEKMTDGDYAQKHEAWAK